MSRGPAPSKRHQYSSNVSDDIGLDDEFRSRGSPQAASSREFSCISSLSELGQKFARVKFRDCMRCEAFIRHYPEILREDPTDFLRVTRAALVAGEKQLAMQCVQQYVLIRDLHNSSESTKESYFRSLTDIRGSEGHFIAECKSVLKMVEERVFDYRTIRDPTRNPSVGSIVPTRSVVHIDSLNPNLQTHRHESLSRLSSLGHVFIQIPINQNARCREFLKKYPEILDDDHDLYISEALSALRGGNESGAQSAIEKSIILRDFDRWRPEKAFQGLSQSVSSAMNILKERANREIIEDLPGRMQTSILPLQIIGSSPGDLPGRHREIRPSVGGFLQTHYGESLQVQVADTSKEPAALKTSILQFRKENEAAEQELQSTRRVLKDQKQKVANTTQELEAAKQEVQKIRKELIHKKQELTVRLEELQSTREELQSHEKELKGSEGQKQALQREKEEIEAAKKLQLLRDDGLREKEKELNKTKVELDRERESIAPTKHEIEAARRPRGFEDTTLPLPATAELPATTYLPIDIQATMEDKATQTTAVDSFDDPAEFEMLRSENESNIYKLRPRSTVFGLLQSAPTVFKTGIQQQQGSVVSSSSNLPFTSNDDSMSFTAIDYLLETDTPTPACTEDEAEDKDARTLEGRWDRRRRKNEVIQGLKFRFKEVETREVDVEAREQQVQFDQDEVKREREIQRKRDRAAFARQCHGCGIALALDFEFPE